MVEVLLPELSHGVPVSVDNSHPQTAFERRAERKQALDKKIVAFAERIDAITEMQERMEEAIQKDPDITPGGLFLVSEAFKGRVSSQDLAVAHEAARI